MNKTKPLSWVKHPLALSVAASSALLLLPSATVQAAEACVAGTWQDAPNGIWSPDQQTYPVRAESEHFQIRFLDSEASISQAQAEAALDAFESMYDWFLTEEVSFSEPFCDSSTKYKIQVFANRNWGLTGSGVANVPAMWVSDGAIQVASEGHIGGLVHEFTHTMQFASGGLRNGGLPGWMWENHAEFMTHSFPEYENKTGCTEIGAWQPHMPFGGSRLRYCNWMFWDYVRMQPDLGMAAVSRLWPHTRNQDDQDPIVAFKEANGLTQSDFQDLYGEFAMTNVNWDYDYYDADNTTRGEKYRSYYGTTDSYDNSAHWWRSSIFLRRARMEVMDLERRRFAVSPYYAPEIYGYNHVLLIPDAGSTSIVLDFQGMVQDAPAPGAQTGVLALEPGGPGAGGAYSLAQDPASAWRWGIVAVTTDGRSRYTEMKAGQSGTLEYPLQGDERYVALAVAATPDVHHGLFWEQLHHTRYRYPYMIQVNGAMPEGYEAGYNPAARFHQFGGGRFHANGGGWVANAATVDDSVYIGPNAAVVGGTVTGNARIEDYAVVWSGNVSGNAVIKGLTQLTREMNVTDNAEIAVTVADGHTFETGTAYLGGSSKFYGDLILTGDFASHGTVTQGAYTGLIFPELTNNPVHGSAMQDMPVEVTARFDPVWHETIRDTDGDGVADENDAFPYDPSEQTDSDGDGIGDNSDPFPESAYPWLNLAPQATLSTSHVSPWEILEAVADEIQPSNSADKTGGAYGNWNGEENYGSTNWVSFTFDQLKRVSYVDVYWWQDGAGIALPTNATVEYWDGGAWRSLGNIDVSADRYNRLQFGAVVTSAVRISMAGTKATGILEARVWGEDVSDSDGDGVIDELDAFPNDANESQDSDGDGVGNNADAFPNDATETEDSDGDGVGNNADAFPNDATETQDSDGDGIGNNADAFPNDASETQDSDGDGVGNNADAFPNDASETQDSDGDGVGNNADAFPNDASETQDSDDDGVGNNADAFPNDASETQDSDGDGVGNNADAFPNDATETADSDGDGVGNNADAFPADPTESLDSDGDGVGNNADAFPTDATETTDTDGDGIGDNSDPYPESAVHGLNLATEAALATSHVSPWETLEAVRDGKQPANSADNSQGAYGNWDGEANYGRTDWVSFTWPVKKSVSSVEVYWWQDGAGIAVPDTAVIEYLTEQGWVSLGDIGRELNQFNRASFEAVNTSAVRVAMSGSKATGILEMRIIGEALPDTDGDGVPDVDDAFPNNSAETADRDGDGVGDNADAFPDDASEQLDSDNDGLGDNSDPYPQAGFDPVNIASSATVETSHVSPWETLAAVNDGVQPASSSDNSNGAYGNWDGEQNYGNTNWVSLNFAESRNIAELSVYWWNDGQGIATPTTAEAEYWDGNQWVSLGNVGTELNTFNSIRFAAISTTAVRISMASDRATGILEVQVLGESNGNEVSAQSLGAERQLVGNADASSSSSSSGGATGIGFIGFLMGLLALVRRRPRK